MASISRASSGQQNKNRLRYHRVKVYIQRFPGKIGTDEERAITEQPDYEVKVDDTVIQWGQLNQDGSIEVFIPGGVQVTLDVLGTTYELELIHKLESENTLRGCQRRLSLLGYYKDEIDAKWGAKTDVATLDFQADNDLDPNGKLLDGTTYNKIKAVFGE